MSARPDHLDPYGRPCPPDVSAFLRGLRGDELSVFGVACRCGETSLIVGINYNWEVVDAGCGTCGHEFPLYDPKVHGHDGSRGVNDYPRPPFEVLPTGCACRMFHFRVGIALHYPAGATGGQDFDWMAIAGRCEHCGQVCLLLDVE